MALTNCAECYVSISRIQSFLLEPESKFSKNPKKTKDDKVKKDEVELDTLLTKPNGTNQSQTNTENNASKVNGNKQRTRRRSRRKYDEIDTRKRVVDNIREEEKGVFFDHATALWNAHDDQCTTGSH